MLVLPHVAPRDALVLIFDRVRATIFAEMKFLLHLLTRVRVSHDCHVALKEIAAARRGPPNRRFIFGNVLGVRAVHPPFVDVLYLVRRRTFFYTLVAIIKLLSVDA